MNDTTRLGNDRLELPEVIHRYQDAHDRHDTEVALSAFAPDATVVDDGREYRGSEQIRQWLRTSASEVTYSRTFVSSEALADDTWLVLNHLEGDFPGRVVDLRYKYVLNADLIAELLIVP